MELYENEQKQETAVLVSVDTGEFDIDSSLLELTELAKTAGAEVIGEITQKREAPDSATYIGKGKLEELTEFCEMNEPDLIIIDGELCEIEQPEIDANMKYIISYQNTKYEFSLEEFRKYRKHIKKYSLFLCSLSIFCAFCSFGNCTDFDFFETSLDDAENAMVKFGISSANFTNC